MPIAGIAYEAFQEGDLSRTENADHSLLTADEVAAILRVPRSWVYSHANLLPSVRLGRYIRFRRRGIDCMTSGSNESEERDLAHDAP